MTRFTREIEVEFNKIDSKELDRWCDHIGKKVEELPSLRLEVTVDVGVEEFEDEEVIGQYAEITRPGDGWIERTYRYLAEGDCAAAMEEMAREFGLAPPSHARAVADLLTRPRA